MIIYLFGPDTFRSRRKLNEIKQKFITEVDKSSLNVESLNGQALDVAAFEKAIFTPPFLAKKRMVIIEDLISKNRGQKLQKEVLKILAKKIPEHAVIIFWEGGKGTATKSKLTASRGKLLDAKLKKEQFAQEFKLLSPGEVYQFAATEIKARGGQASPSAIRLLSDLVENDLWQLSTEIDKLIAFASGKQITDQHIKKLVKTKLDDDIFKLTDAIGQKNKALALKLISDQLSSGTAPVELLSKITWQFKNLLLVKSFVEEQGGGYGDSSLGYQLGLHPFVVKKTMSQVQNHDYNDLKTIYNNLMTIDFKLKTSQVDPEVLFDLLVVKS